MRLSAEQGGFLETLGDRIPVYGKRALLARARKPAEARFWHYYVEPS